jgi:hypothetical protein
MNPPEALRCELVHVRHVSPIGAAPFWCPEGGGRAERLPDGQIRFRFSEFMSSEQFLKIKNILLPFSPKSRA